MASVMQSERVPSSSFRLFLPSFAELTVLRQLLLVVQGASPARQAYIFLNMFTANENLSTRDNYSI